jgi:hypothetical protein
MEVRIGPKSFQIDNIPVTEKGVGRWLCTSCPSQNFKQRARVFQLLGSVERRLQRAIKCRHSVFHHSVSSHSTLTMDLTTNSSISPTRFTFPILKSGEILKCLSELGIEMSEEELTNPQRYKEKLRQFFMHLVRNLQSVCEPFALPMMDRRCGYTLV